MSAAVMLDPDDVSLQLGSTNFRGWQTVSITRSCETLPNSFSVTASAEFMQGPALAQTRPGQPCNIYIGNNLVITGWLDRRTIQTSPENRVVSLIGRGITRNLVDCSADLVANAHMAGGMINAANTLELAKIVSDFTSPTSAVPSPPKITVRSAVDDLGIPILPIQVALGETPYQIIESVARYAGYLVYEDENGALVLDRVGTQSMASGFIQPGNIEALAAMQSEDQRYSHYFVVWQAISQYQELSPISNQRGSAIDKTMPEYRPLIRVSAQLSPAYDIGKAMANWEWARRLGRSQAATITCDSWRDKNNQLWTPNWLAPIEAPASDITGAKWIIGTVTFRKDMSGTHADLVLMPPAAFEVQPNPLNLWNAELTQQTTQSQAPAPPSTNPATEAPPWLPGPS